MIYGGASFVAFEPESRRFLVILRNVTSWPAAEDFELSARHFGRIEVSLDADGKSGISAGYLDKMRFVRSAL